MTEETVCSNNSDWNNDKSDEIFFSLLGELLQNNTRKGYADLYALLSSQANHKSHFQNDNEYRCEEDALEEEESELNKLVDIIQNRLQNGKSVPAGLTRDKLARLKDDFLKQKEENKRNDKGQSAPPKKVKSTPIVPVAKPKPKSKKQLQAEQRRREMEKAKIAEELEEKKKKDEEKDFVKKQQESERQLRMEEEMKKQEEEKKRQLNEAKKKREREEREREQRSLKEKERQDRLRKQQEEDVRRREEEKRRKAEEKAAKQKATKEAKEREEREKLEKASKSQNKRQQQYQQYQQQQQKYPREVPPRFLRQQQMKQQVPRKDYDYNYNDSNHYRDSSWTEIVPDSNYDSTKYEENWDTNDEKAANQNSWGGVPPTENWDADESSTNPSINANKTPAVVSKWTSESSRDHSPIGSERKTAKSIKTALFGPSDPPPGGHVTPAQPSTSILGPPPVPEQKQPLNHTDELPPQKQPPSVSNNTDMSWGASLTGSTWDGGNSTIKTWDSSSSNDVIKNEPPPKVSVTGNSASQLTSISENSESKSESLNRSIEQSKVGNSVSAKATDTPGLTAWAGLDSFDATPMNSELNTTSQSTVFTGGAKPKTSCSSQQSDSASEKHKQQRKANEEMFNSNNSSNYLNSNGVTPLDSKVDSNLKVTGWLQSSGGVSSEDWDEEEKETGDENWGWTTVASVKTKQKTVTSAPGTPSKNDSNAWTNRALKQLLDMGFKREHAEKALRDNNGVIEGAVNDLVLMEDSTADSSQPTKSENSSIENKDTPQLTPHKLNRKQRRKLQQMQNQQQQQTQSQSITQNSATTQPPTPANDTAVTSTPKPPVLNNPNPVLPKSKGDGLLPTPPPSLRLVPATGDKPRTVQPAPSGLPSNKQSSSKQQPLLPRPQGQVGPIQKPPAAGGPDPISKPSQPAPVGSDRPSSSSLQQSAATQPPASVQQPTAMQVQSQPTAQTHPQAPIQQPASVGATDSGASATNAPINQAPSSLPINSATLDPPINPVLLAEIKLEQMKIRDQKPGSGAGSTVPSQTPTNMMIEQYLQQIAQQGSEMKASSSSGMAASSILQESPHTSLSDLSGLLRQAPPNPASSLSNGPQKSKLLQWTQPLAPVDVGSDKADDSADPSLASAASTPPAESSSKSITPPVGSVPNEIARTIDPISARWGVLAAPRLSPTPAEFKPGVPWRSRGDPLKESNSESSSVASIPAQVNGLTGGRFQDSSVRANSPVIADNSGNSTPADEPMVNGGSDLPSTSIANVAENSIPMPNGLVGLPDQQALIGQPVAPIGQSVASVRQPAGPIGQPVAPLGQQPAPVGQSVAPIGQTPAPVSLPPSAVMSAPLQMNPMEGVPQSMPAPIGQQNLVVSMIGTPSVIAQTPQSMVGAIGQHGAIGQNGNVGAIGQQSVSMGMNGQSAGMNHPSNAAVDQQSVRPPPGLSSHNAFNGMKPRPQTAWMLLKGLNSAVDPTSLRSLCQQYGTLLHFRVIGNVVYVRYETANNATQAAMALNGKIIFNSQLTAELSTDQECEKVIQAVNMAPVNPTLVATPIGNHIAAPQPQPMQPAPPPAFTSLSSFGTVWTAPGQNSQPTNHPAFMQQNFPAQSQPVTLQQAFGAPMNPSMNPSSMTMNGAFNPWGMPAAPQPMMPNASHLWAPAQPPQQQAAPNMFQAFPGWVQAKQDMGPVQGNILSPGMDRCLPSELLGKEQTS